jgi:glyoxylase-like metal-dependent hydrolase (beta-lactamase superfamily II)
MSSSRILQSSNPQSLAKAARLQCGDLEIAVLYDGYNDITLEFFNAPDRGRFAPLLAAAGMPEHPIRVPINGFLLRDEGRTLLIESGMGHYHGPTMGYMRECLALIGVEPEEVTDIVPTHLHRDHVGGLMTPEETPAYSRATVHVPREEHAFWTDQAATDALPAAFQPMVRIARTAMKAYEGRLRLMEPATQLTRRVRVSPLAGHSPGHSCVWFESGASRVCLWGDVIHCAALQFPVPEISFKFDYDIAVAQSGRRQILEHAAREKFFVAGAHMPFPAIGTVATTAEGGFRFSPLANGER